MSEFKDRSFYSEEENNLWEMIKTGEGKIFFTYRGLPFTYEVIGNNLIVSRKKKPIERSMVNRAFRTAMSNEITNPKKLVIFGASYIYPIFIHIGLIKQPGKEETEENKTSN